MSYSTHLTRTLVGAAVIATAALGVITSPAMARPSSACTAARGRLALDMRFLTWAHNYSDQATINFYRSLVYDDQTDVLNSC